MVESRPRKRKHPNSKAGGSFFWTPGVLKLQQRPSNPQTGSLVSFWDSSLFFSHKALQQWLPSCRGQLYLAHCQTFSLVWLPCWRGRLQLMDRTSTSLTTDWGTKGSGFKPSIVWGPRAASRKDPGVRLCPGADQLKHLNFEHSALCWSGYRDNHQCPDQRHVVCHVTLWVSGTQTHSITWALRGRC